MTRSSDGRPVEFFYIEINCCCPSNGDTFTRIAKCTAVSWSASDGSRLTYEVQILDDPNPKAIGPCRFYPQSGEDPRLWIGRRLAKWLGMFLSSQGPEWLTAYELIDLEQATRRRVELEV